jgi:DNA-binding NarL/FixJ family response regulator
MRRDQPDVAVLDLRMPQLNGIEVLLQLNKSYPRTAVVICSADSDTSDTDAVEAAFGVGALSGHPKTGH